FEYHDRLTDVWVKTGNGSRVLASHYSVPRKEKVVSSRSLLPRFRSAAKSSGRGRPLYTFANLHLREGVLQRWALRSEQFRASFHDVHVVLQTDAEFSADVNAWFIAKGHLRLEFCRVAAHQVGPLVAVHAHAVSQAMGEVHVTGAEARFGDDLARGGVHGTGFNSGFGGRERRALGPMHDVEDPFHFVARFAEHKRTGDVGLITFHGAATVDHHDRAVTNHLRLHRAVGERGKLANLYIGAALESQFAVRGFQKLPDVPLRHAYLQRTVGCLVGGECDL